MHCFEILVFSIDYTCLMPQSCTYCNS